MARTRKGASRGRKQGKKSARSRADSSSENSWIRLFFYAAILIGVGYAATRVPVGGKTLSEHLGGVELWSRTRHAAQQAAAAFAEGEGQKSKEQGSAGKPSPAAKTGQTARAPTKSTPPSSAAKTPKTPSPTTSAPPSSPPPSSPSAKGSPPAAGPVPTLAGSRKEAQELNPRSDLGDRPPAEEISASERMALEELLPR